MTSQLLNTLILVGGLYCAYYVMKTGNLPGPLQDLIGAPSSSGGGGGEGDTSTASGPSMSGFKEEDQSGSKRWDYEGTQMDSIEITGYFKGTPTDDDVSAKLGGGRHTNSAPNDGCCYSIGFHQQGKNVRVRFECPHPDYSGNLSVGPACEPLKPDKLTGYRAVKKNEADGVLIEWWQDASGNPAAPQWKKIHSFKDTKYKLFKPKGSTWQATWRIDDAKATGSNLSVRAVGSAAPTTPATATPPATAKFTRVAGQKVVFHNDHYELFY